MQRTSLSPEEARAQAQESDVRRLLGALPRTLAHAVKDALLKAWEAGYEYRGRHPG